MKKLFYLIFFLICSCGHQVDPEIITLEKLTSILTKDTKEEKNVVWAYDGTDSKYHYFDRIVASALTFDPDNGIYILDKSALNLQDREFTKTTDGSGHIKSGIIFTKRVSSKIIYGTQFLDQEY